MKGGMGADKLSGYTKFQVASSIPLAAQNEGLGGVGASLGAGVGVGQAIGQAIGASLGQPGAASVAPAPAVAPAEEPVEARLEKLKGLLDKGLISAADYDNAKAELLKKLIG